MKKHIPIVIGLLILGTALAPVLGATLIGVIEGDPLFVFAPAVIPIAFMLVGPPAFIMSLSLVWLGLRNISQDKPALRLSSWVKQFTLAGIGLGALSLLYMGFLAVWISDIKSQGRARRVRRLSYNRNPSGYSVRTLVCRHLVLICSKIIL